ncbi:SLBB domain-containing protein [Alteromonas sp. ASW11-36]|uniref:SLBB domain-containing protein n=1 Tax=Alteromonas arenosi TaxID=3055817 RepID=A0ABT7T0J7_9ALTE|nr:SLBB domain-containing protein [Alteromonas sp. ASW11-36]MDM7861969.1 SLBB domain-containing protein [Alteromonas sp. ASW11-36]
MPRTLRFLFAILLITSFSAASQGFTPSPAQIEQFKQLPRAQQVALARQMGIDISDIDAALNVGGKGQSQEMREPVDVVERVVDEAAVAEELSQQSSAKQQSAKLKPFGYNIFTDAAERFSPSANTPVPSDYVLGPGDSVNVRLFGKVSDQFELSVSNEGFVEVPELGPMVAAGSTYQELKQQLTDKYSEQMIGVSPHITMGQLRTIQVFIVGEAFRPGAYTVSSLATVTTALFNSGGVSNIGSLRNIELKRSGKTVAQFDLYDLLVFGDTSADVRLQQGDVLFIPPVKTVVSIDGEVRRPAIYEIKGDENLQDLLSLAGGLLPSAEQSNIQIARSTSQGLKVNTVDTTIRNQAGRFELANGDFVNVPASTAEFNNAVLVVGAVNNPGLVQHSSSLALSNIVSEATLLSSTDLSYALVVRKAKFDVKTSVVQFKPTDVINGRFDLDLQPFDSVILFNRFGGNDARGNEASATSGGLQAAQGDERVEDYLLELERSAFTEKQLILKATQNFSRRELLAPVVARLKLEANEEAQVNLAEVTGQVRFPGVYPISQGSTVKHLIEAAGGLLDSAYTVEAELSRTFVTSEGVQIKHIVFDPLSGTSVDSSDVIYVSAKDKLNILRTPDWFESNRVELVGEFKFPGVYQISKGETLADLIARAGGVTEKATLNAAIFTREELRERERQNIDRSVQQIREQVINSNLNASQYTVAIDYTIAQDILNDLTAVEPVGRMVIDLPAALAQRSNANIELKDGDVVYLPNITPAISVIGEVYVPTTLSFNSDYGLEDYIEMTGGYKTYADASSVYIVKANGSVEVPSSDFWFNGETSVVLEPGDTIVVPRDVTNYDNLGLWQAVTQIAYQAAIAVAAINSF